MYNSSATVAPFTIHLDVMHCGVGGTAGWESTVHCRGGAHCSPRGGHSPGDDLGATAATIQSQTYYGGGCYTYYISTVMTTP